MYLNLYDIIILFGALQGLILSLVLFFSRPEERTTGKNYFLALLLLILVYNGLETFSWSSEITRYNYFFNLFSNVLIFGLGPCLYLYLRSFTRPQTLTGKLVAKHFAIVGLQFTARIFILVISILNTRGTFTGLWSADLDSHHTTVSENLSVVAFWFYLSLSSREIWLYQKNIEKVTPEEQVAFRWMRSLFICMLILGIAWAITTVYPIVVKASSSNYYYPIEVLQVLFIYWLGITGFYRIKVVHVDTQNRSNAFFESIDSDTLQDCEKALIKAMEQDKLYLETDLNVSKLADHIRINQKTISAVLNQHMQKGFPEFVNYYRIQEVKERMAHPKYQSLTIAGIAYDSGFNSLPTFQRVFKASENMTPKEYLASVTKAAPKKA
ncbi:helix-turn-helix domain-containing protein [Pontibacter sp. MBLB2868]|uniref:helix-turn-helix domain-containing protein n=1 Tax=Pontibacter sp. MBLB2868 TaxID=3451555 RepID=UPI003F753049